MSFECETEYQLDGWDLAWFCLKPTGRGGADLQKLCRGATADLRAEYSGGTITDRPVVQRIRQLFRAAGCDPTRYRPSSEALVRRVLKGEELPEITPLVDLNNLLSLRLLVPCCVADGGRLRPPFVLRAGREDEIMQAMRGSFKLVGKPVLVDQVGPFGTPITDDERVKVTARSEEVWLVAYLPSGVVSRTEAAGALNALLDLAPVAELIGSS